VFSQEDPTRAFTQLFSALDDDGVARASVIAIPQTRSTAWSGELRGHVDSVFGHLRQRVELTVRGRRQRSQFGGAQVVELGSVPFGERPAAASPPLPDNSFVTLRDRVDQWGAGLTYRGSLHDRLLINLGVLRTTAKPDHASAL
jgi:iron complex outermembrane recepter protein